MEYKLKKTVKGSYTFLVPERYEIQRLIGKGAYGVVVEAFDSVTKKKVAIKKIFSVFEHGKEYQKRILRELLVLNHFRCHDNIICIKDIILPPSYESFDDVYIVTDHMDGDIRLILKSQKDLTEQNIQFFIYQILRGLKYIHSAAVIHRDIKPSNILINQNMDIKIADFGLARGIDIDDKGTDTDGTKMSTAYVATRWYRAPELLLNYDKGQTSIDVWSVGCILAEFLQPKPPILPNGRRSSRKVMFPGKNWLSQLNLVLDFCGTPEPDEEIKGVESAKKYVRNYPKRKKVNLKKVFPNASHDVLDLLDKMLTFNPDKRISCEDALNHKFFKAIRIEEPSCNNNFNFRFTKQFEDKGISIKKIMYDFMVFFNKKTYNAEKFNIEIINENNN